MDIRRISDLYEYANKYSLTFGQAAIKIEAEEQEKSEHDIRSEMAKRIDVMRNAVKSGLEGTKSVSGMVGGQGKIMSNYFNNELCMASPIYAKAISYALAANECNACMGVIVAAPTAGASGILPALVCALEEERSIDENKLVEGIAAAGAVGAVIARNASLAGAEGGCQAECGSGAAMAAFSAVEMLGGSKEQAMQAGAITLQGMLGLVCDPVAGLVEIPCVHRNATSITQALMATDMALAGVTFAIPVDEVIDTMDAVGRALPSTLRETAQGGLAISPTGLAIAEKVLGVAK